MNGIHRSARPWARAGLALCVLALPLTATGVAAAEPVGITPVLECVAVDPDGGYTAVLGYDNPSAGSVPVPHGQENRITPGHLQGSQPTSFLPGRQRGVFSLTVEHGAPVLRWTLDGTTAVLSPRGEGCPPATEMPVDGNGTGLAVGLGAAGLIGVVLVRRMQRQVAVADPSLAGPARPEDDHA
jgi:hypothetical protein